MAPNNFNKGLINDLKKLQERVNTTDILPCNLQTTLEQLSKYAQQASTIEKTAETESSLNYLLGQILTHLFHANNQAGLNLSQVTQQALENLSASSTEATNQNRIIMVYDTYAELLVEGEVRGTIPVYDRCDQDELRDIAKLFQCQLKFAESEQLGIFSVPQKKTSIELEKMALNISDQHIENEMNQLSLLTNLLTTDVKESQAS